jgi:hypothetical protein
LQIFFIFQILIVILFIKQYFKYKRYLKFSSYEEASQYYQDLSRVKRAEIRNKRLEISTKKKELRIRIEVEKKEKEAAIEQHKQYELKKMKDALEERMKKVL